MLVLLATVVLLFGFQAETILAEPVAIVLIAIPLLIQIYSSLLSLMALPNIFVFPIILRPRLA